MQNNQPVAHIFAGANASGKSTFIAHLMSVGIIDNQNYICPDLILREDLKLEETLENYIIAAKEAEARVQHLIDSKEDIILETVFSTQKKLDLLNQLKEQRYETIIYFTGVESSDINVLYLKNRVEQGGHDVPIKKLLTRREAGFENIKKAINSIDCLVLIDNSLIYKAPVVVQSLYKGQVCFINPSLDREITWVDKITDSITRIDKNNIPQKHLDFCNNITNSLSSFSETLKKNYDEKNAILKSNVNENQTEAILAVQVTLDNPKLQQELEKAGAGHVAVLAKDGLEVVKDSDLGKSNVTKSLIEDKPKGMER